MREPEDFLPPHVYLHGANLSQWKNNNSHAIIQSADIIEDAECAELQKDQLNIGRHYSTHECSSAIARLQRIKSELLRDKGIELRKYRKKVS